MANPRLLSAVAILLAGDAAAALAGPRRHVALWTGKHAPGSYRSAMRWLTEHPGVLMVGSVVQLAAGVAIARMAQRRAATI